MVGGSSPPLWVKRNTAGGGFLFALRQVWPEGGDEYDLDGSVCPARSFGRRNFRYIPNLLGSIQSDEQKEMTAQPFQSCGHFFLE